MNSKKILVTGAGGFIGGHFSRYLKNKGYWVRGVDIKRHQWMKSSEFCDEFFHLDLTDWNNVRTSVQNIDEIYNFAANMGGIGYIMSQYAEVIHDSISINKNIAEAARMYDVDKIFFSSSACIYPEYLQEKTHSESNKEYILSEKDAFPADPDSFYGWEKLFSEILYWSYYIDYGIDIRIARFHNIQGIYTEWKEPKCKAPAALSRKIAQLPKKGGEIEIWGDGNQVRTFLDITDCIEGVYKLMNCNNSKYYKLGNKNKPRPPALNIGSTEETTITNLVDLLSKIAEKPIKKVYNMTKPQGVRSRSADISSSKKILNWEPKITLSETMERLYKWVEREVSKK
jgi:nucleoside-diphosphate-sugar epimerase